MKTILKKATEFLKRCGQPRHLMAKAEPEPPRPVGTDISTASVSGHGSLFKVVRDCADLLNQLEETADKLDEGARPLAEHVRVTLQEIIERAGGTRLENEPAFDVARHQAVPVSRVKQGTPILATIEPGYLYDGRIIKRARVRVTT